MSGVWTCVSVPVLGSDGGLRLSRLRLECGRRTGDRERGWWFVIVQGESASVPARSSLPRGPSFPTARLVSAAPAPPSSVSLASAVLSPSV